MKIITGGGISELVAGDLTSRAGPNHIYLTVKFKEIPLLLANQFPRKDIYLPDTFSVSVIDDPRETSVVVGDGSVTMEEWFEFNEGVYNQLRKKHEAHGFDVLPQCIAVDTLVTANLTEWKQIFKELREHKVIKVLRDYFWLYFPKEV